MGSTREGRNFEGEHMHTAVAKINPATSVLARMAGRFGVDETKMMATLKATAFRGDVSTEQMMALCIVAEQYNLNPWTKEIYAFPDRNNGIVPVVGVDGWSLVINSNPQFDGMDFEEGPANERKIPEWIECRMHRKDRGHPICVREYFADGTKFGELASPSTPFSFTLNANPSQVIPGWNEGIVGMKVGGTCQLIIPPSLAYGATGSGPIPPNAVLVFNVQLVTVQ
jgi:hypothetical protein